MCNISRSRFHVLGWLVLGVLSASLVACGQNTASLRPVTCQTAYRSSQTVGIQQTQPMTLTAGTHAPATIAYPDLSMHGQYVGDTFESPAINLFVTLPGRDERIMSVLYQLPQATSLVNQFAGGHGFTGLHYVYHPTSGAELQFWCTAD